MAIDVREFLEVEAHLGNLLTTAWAEVASSVFAEVQRAIKDKDFDRAVALAEAVDLSEITPKVEDSAYTLFRAAVNFGSWLAAKGRPLSSSLVLDYPVQRSLAHLRSSLEWGATQAVQDQLLQLIAQAREDDQAQAVFKADPVRPFVSFKVNGDKLMQMISSLHASRLSGWGFVAESDLRGQTTYKLTAVLDNRTSAFCRMIHGKVFKIDNARGLIDQAIHADNPTDLRTIHPWPRQDKASIAEYEQMSTDELIAAGLHVPPFHPYCRTLMVPVDYKSNIKAPAAREQVIPEYQSTLDTFSQLGVKFNEAQLRVWNDYVGMNPVDVLSALTGQSVAQVLADKAAMIKITPKGNLVFGWGGQRLTFDPAAGSLSLRTEGKITEFGAFKGSKTGLVAFAKSVGAESLGLRVAFGEAVEALSLGVVPAADAWQAIRVGLAALITGNLSSDFGRLSKDHKRLLMDILNSNLESRAVDLLKLPQKFVQSLLANVQYQGVVSS